MKAREVLEKFFGEMFGGRPSDMAKEARALLQLLASEGLVILPKEPTEGMIELLKDILRYRRGEGSYNFSDKPDDVRENYAFDAWCQIENRIGATLHSYQREAE